jgi:hypothetical protein
VSDQRLAILHCTPLNLCGITEGFETLDLKDAKALFDELVS